MKCKLHGSQSPNEYKQRDIHLWITILQQVSTKGIDINNITFTEPTNTTISDACECGIGGFNLTELAWRYTLPAEFIGCFSIKLLEFIVAAIIIYLTIVDATTPHKLLAYIDSSSALGWLYKFSFTINQPAHDKVVWWLAKFIIENDTAL